MCDDNINPEHKSKLSTDFISSMVSGAIYSILFNPWDRAVYLSMKHKRAFLKRDNFINPYHGSIQAMTHRMFFGSTYYMVQGQMRSSLVPYLHHILEMDWPLVHVITGCSAGAVNGFFTNGFSLIKAHTWGNNNGTCRSSFKEIYEAGGIGAFARGLWANILTDSIRGGSYELVRNVLREKITHFRHESDKQSKYINFSCDATAAFVGTIVASPMNYARIQKYSIAPNMKPPSITASLKSVWSESKIHSNKLSKRIGFFQTRFCITTGTIRAAAGMAVGQLIFDEMRTRLKS